MHRQPRSSVEVNEMVRDATFEFPASQQCDVGDALVKRRCRSSVFTAAFCGVCCTATRVGTQKDFYLTAKGKLLQLL